MNLKESIYVAIGQASMCWSETPKGVFDDSEATKVAEELYGKVQQAKNSISVIVTKEEINSWAIGSDKYRIPLQTLYDFAVLNHGKSMNEIFDNNGTGKRREPISNK